MFIHRLWQYGAAILAIGLLLGPAMAAEQIRLTGQVTYRERIALPPDAQLQVTLVALDAPHVARAGATAAINGPGQVPLQFVLNVRSDTLSLTKSYGLVAEIRSGGATMFASRAPVPVDPAAPEPVLILVNFAAPAPVEASPSQQDPSALFDTLWNVRSLNGKPVLKSTEMSLSIAPDRRAGGNGGCNNYFTEAMLDGPALSFGPVAATRMACDTTAMQQEAAFFAALATAAGYELAGDRLDLLDTNGKSVIGLSRS